MGRNWSRSSVCKQAWIRRASRTMKRTHVFVSLSQSDGRMASRRAGGRHRGWEMNTGSVKAEIIGRIASRPPFRMVHPLTVRLLGCPSTDEESRPGLR